MVKLFVIQDVLQPRVGKNEPGELASRRAT